MTNYLQKVQPQFINNKTSDYQDVSFSLVFADNIKFDRFDFDPNQTGINIKRSYWLSNILVTNNIETKIPKQIIDINLIDVQNLRHEIITFFNDFLKENKDLILKEEENNPWIVEDLLNTPYVMDKVHEIFQNKFTKAKIDAVDINGYFTLPESDNKALIEVYIRISNEQFINLIGVDNPLDAETMLYDKVLYLPELEITYK